MNSSWRWRCMQRPRTVPSRTSNETASSCRGGRNRGSARRDGLRRAAARDAFARAPGSALLIDRQDDGVSRRVHVEADDILDLLGEGRVVRALEGAQAMRLQMMRVPDALDGAQRDADRRGDGASGPMRHLARRLGAGEGEDLGNGAGRVRRRAGRPRLVAQEPIDALLAETLLPAPHGRPADARAPSNLEDRQTLGRQQHDARPQHVLQRPRPVADDLDKARSISFVGKDTNSLSHRSDSHARTSL